MTQRKKKDKFMTLHKLTETLPKKMCVVIKAKGGSMK